MSDDHTVGHPRSRLSPARVLILSTPPWVRGPVLIMKEPLAALAVLVVASILGLAATSGPLFVSSVGTAGLHEAAARRCVQDDQVTAFNVLVDQDPNHPQTGADVAAADPLIRQAMERNWLPSPVLTTYTVLTIDDRPGQRAEVGLFANSESLSHVDIVEQVPGDGLFIPDTYAEEQGLRPGDSLVSLTGSARVAGIYRDLDTASYRTVLPEFWCHWRNLIVTTASNRPPPFLLAGPETLAALSSNIRAEWTSPIDVDQLTLAEAEGVAAIGARLIPAAEAGTDTTGLSEFATRSQLGIDAEATRKLQLAVAAPVGAIAISAVALSLLLVGGSVFYWRERRRREIRLLTARGVSPAALGMKAASELALPSVVGCALGWAAGLLLVPAVAPSPLTEPGAIGSAASTVALCWLVCLLVIVGVTAIAVRERHRPWGSALTNYGLAAAVVGPIGAAWALFSNARLAELTRPGVYRIDPQLLLAPLLALTGVVLAGAVLLVAPLPRLRRAAGGRGMAVFTAVSRAAAIRGPLLVVICALAIPTGLAVYSAGFTRSTALTVQAKADTFTGAAEALRLRTQLGETIATGGAATPVSYVLARSENTDEEIQLLGVDAATFAEYALFDPALTGRQLSPLLGELRQSTGDGAAPAILVTGQEMAAVAEVRARSSTLSVEVVERVPVFPGMRYPNRPMLVVDLSQVIDLDQFAGWKNELWTDGDHLSEVMRTLTELDVLTDAVGTPEDFTTDTNLRPVTWTFDYLRAIAGLVAAVSITGLLLYVVSRQRRQLPAYVMLRRMGMSSRGYRRSLTIELTALGGWAWLTGSVAGILCLTAATKAIDINPAFAPPTLLGLPISTVIFSGLALPTSSVLLAWWTQRSADRNDPGTVMRT